MLGPALNGALAAAIVCSLFFFQDRFPEASRQAGFVLVIGVVAAFLQWLLVDRKNTSGARRNSYLGVSETLVQIHSPETSEPAGRWIGAGIVSWFLSWVNGNTGPEGSAAELNYAILMRTRPSSARWFEQRRRTDAACMLASSIAAAFCAPFAAVLVPIELGIGGRVLSSVICALVASLGVKLGAAAFGLKLFDSDGTLDAVEFASFGVGSFWWRSRFSVNRGSGFACVHRPEPQGNRASRPAMGQRTDPCRGNFSFPDRPCLSSLIGFALQDRPGSFLTEVPASESGILFFAKCLSFVLILIGFGTAGVFWPIFSLGALLGFAMHHFVFESLLQNWFPGIEGFAPMVALAAASSFWGAVLGLPIAGSVLVLEITGEPRVGVLCLGASLIANFVARKFMPPLMDRDLASKGLRIMEGRSRTILETLRVSDAMVTDHETIHERAGERIAGQTPWLRDILFCRSSARTGLTPEWSRSI